MSGKPLQRKSPNVSPQADKRYTVLTLKAVDVTTGVSIAIPVCDRVEISHKRRYVTTTGIATTAVAGDDGTITVSVDGVNYFNPNTVAGTAVVLGCDDNGVANITSKCGYVKIATAQVAADETVEYNIVCISE